MFCEKKTAGDVAKNRSFRKNRAFFLKNLGPRKFSLEPVVWESRHFTARAHWQLMHAILLLQYVLQLPIGRVEHRSLGIFENECLSPEAKLGIRLRIRECLSPEAMLGIRLRIWEWLVPWPILHNESWPPHKCYKFLMSYTLNTYGTIFRNYSILWK